MNSKSDSNSKITDATFAFIGAGLNSSPASAVLSLIVPNQEFGNALIITGGVSAVFGIHAVGRNLSPETVEEYILKGVVVGSAITVLNNTLIASM